MLRSTRKSTGMTIGSTAKKYGGGLPLQNTNGNGHDTSWSRHRRISQNASAQGYVTNVMIAGAVIVCIFFFVSSSSSKNSTSSFQHHRLKETTDEAYYDVTVLGTGPAGLTASLFAARAGLTVLVLGSDAGQLSEAAALDNFPSWTGTGGASWLTATKQQAATHGVHFGQAGLLVSHLSKNGALFTLRLSPSITVHSRAVIVATGAVNRNLKLEHEIALWGKSIHSCAICDGSAYSGNKTVVVVGGGDAAVDAAILLSRHDVHVILIHRREDFRASNQRNLQAMRDRPNIQVKTPYELERYEVSTINQQLAAVHVRQADTDTTERIACDGVFVMIGSIPNTEFLRGTVDLNSDGLIVLRNDGTTASSVDGVFAAGEVTDNQYKQAITAAAAGAQAAIDAERWLRQNAPASSRDTLPDNIPLQTMSISNQNEIHVNLAKSAEGPTATEDCDLAREDCIRALVHKYPVVVFSKPWCPYCKKALEALAVEGVKEPFLFVVNLVDERAKDIQNTLAIMTGRRTVPNVFVGGASIGGGDETANFRREGKLRSLLESAKAFPSEEVAVDCDLTSTDCITSVVEKYPVVVFSKPWCPYCRRAIEVLSIEGVSGEPYLYIIDLAALGERGGAIQDTLQQMTGRRTVPNVFVGGKSIGGGDETTGLHREGKLRPLLEQAKAFA